jgi:glycosyltransferase involved in cell wall biosynthesis
MNRILHLIKGLGRGGAEQLLASAAPYLDAARFEQHVAYLIPHKNLLVPELAEAGIAAHCLGEGTRGAWVGRLRGFVRAHGIDLVHSHSPYMAVGSRLGVGKRVRHVHTEHNVWDSYHPATRWANLLTFPRNDHVFAVSEHVSASIRYPKGLRFLRMPHVETLYHGLDPAALSRWGDSDGIRTELGLPPETPLFGTVANFRPQKGHRDLVEAAVHVREAIPEARLLLVGQGPAEADVRRQVRELGLEDTVLFLGQRDDAPRVAGSLDVFVLASLFEGLAIALIEAMSLGRASVVTGVGGLGEVIRHGENGLIVPPREPKALAEAIVTLLRDDGMRRRLGQEARRRAEDFDIRVAVERVQQVYEELLA